MEIKIKIITRTDVRVYGSTPYELEQNYKVFMAMIGWDRFRSVITMLHGPIGSKDMRYYHQITLTDPTI